MITKPDAITDPSRLLTTGLSDEKFYNPTTIQECWFVREELFEQHTSRAKRAMAEFISITPHTILQVAKWHSPQEQKIKVEVLSLKENGDLFCKVIEPNGVTQLFSSGVQTQDGECKVYEDDKLIEPGDYISLNLPVYRVTTLMNPLIPQ